jgi:hypothetical protein
MAEGDSFFQPVKDSFAGFSTLINGVSPAAIKGHPFKLGIDILRKYDLGRTAYFLVAIPTKNNFGAGGVNFAEKSEAAYFCHSAEMPGESTATVNQKIYGVTEKFAVMTGYNDITLSFFTLGSGEETIRKQFLTWLADITGRSEALMFVGKAPKETTYNVKYKSEYVRDITITHYAITGEPLTEVTLYDAFPIAINQVPLNWAAQNQVQSLNVTFAYTEYTYKFLNVQGTGKYSAGGLSELLGTAIQTASTINTIKGAFKSGNPLAATSTLSNFNLSSRK